MSWRWLKFDANNALNKLSLKSNPKRYFPKCNFKQRSTSIRFKVTIVNNGYGHYDIYVELLWNNIYHDERQKKLL